MEPSEVLASAIRLASSEGFNYSDEYWALVRALQKIPEREVFELAAACCAAPSAPERIVGAEVLAQLGPRTELGTRPFTAETSPILKALLRDSDNKVLSAAIHALGGITVSRLLRIFERLLVTSRSTFDGQWPAPWILTNPRRRRS